VHEQSPAESGAKLVLLERKPLRDEVRERRPRLLSRLDLLEQSTDVHRLQRSHLVNRPEWKVARLSEIPAASKRPGFSPEEYRQAMAERAPHILERWADARERFQHANRKTHDVRGSLGVESFGVNAFEAHAGELLVVPHDELGEGEQQEELYLVVEGRAGFVCDGERVELEPGQVLFARPGVRREAVALETPTMLLIVGGRPGRAYEPPIWARDWRPTDG
jgi:mannose-6-phosphate isomerase-like protein (cupin superfamily)